MAKKRGGGGAKGGVSASDATDFKGQKMDIKSIMKDIENYSFSHMTWKQKKDLENRKVVSLGGKPPKKQRLPLSVARVMMKNQKEREQKMSQEKMILERFGGRTGGGSKRATEKRKPEDRVLKSTEGYFRNGVLDVKHLLQPGPSRESDNGGHGINKGKKKSSGKKNRGKKKGGGRKHH